MVLPSRIEDIVEQYADADCQRKVSNSNMVDI